MTSEVCIMNRLAVVLAADSATTVTYWGEGAQEERYFKGANKIFQLSNFHPIGLMIYDSADLLNVPWEIVIKAFRDEIGAKSFNDLSGYADEFFGFLQNNAKMFPQPVQMDAFLNAVRIAAIGMVTNAVQKGGPKDREVADLDAAVMFQHQRLEKREYLSCIDEKLAAETMASVRDDVIQSLAGILDALKISHPTDIGKLADAALLEVFKNPRQHMSTAGLVFAGFGDHSIFPSMIEYISCGMLANKHVHIVESQMDIDHTTPAWLSAFAQQSMINTFSAGVSFDIYSSVMRSVGAGLSSFADQVAVAAGSDVSKIQHLDDIVKMASENISDAVLELARREHAIPMRRILGALPVEELAELAETLITLQSLKEKVTKPSETVGGPVDVAVITRNEGLVWIKRKHFFDSRLNSRYMHRQMAIYK